MNDKYIIPLNGLAAGKNELFWKVGKEFFESFENQEILDAQIDISVVVEKSGRYVGVDCEVTGEVVVECDRCLEELVVPVDAEVRLSVKYGDVEQSDEHQDAEREVVFVPEDEAELDMSQIVYDYVCVSLPMQKTHNPGECNPETMKYYGSSADFGCSVNPDDNNPFSALKDMFK